MIALIEWVAVNKEATEPRVPSDYFEAITSNVLWSPTWLITLRKLCVTQWSRN